MFDLARWLADAGLSRYAERSKKTGSDVPL